MIFLYYISVESISMFLNATREAVEQFTFNITTFISENERIISEIDDIIAGLADIHERANAVSVVMIGTTIPITDTNHLC